VCVACGRVLTIWLIINPVVYLCFGAGATWLLAIFLAKRECEKHGQALLAEMLESLGEFLVIVTAVAGLYSMVSLIVSRIVPDTTTLYTFNRWESKTRSAYETLKSLDEHTAIWLVILAAAVGAQLYLVRTQHLQQAAGVARSWKAVSAGRTWLKRAYLVLLVSASFTFLGAATNGPYAALIARIDDIKQQYTDFRAQLRDVLQKQMQQDALAAADTFAAERMPDLLQAAIAYSAEKTHSEEHIEQNRTEYRLAKVDTGTDQATTKELIAEAQQLESPTGTDSSDDAAVRRDAAELSRSKVNQMTVALQLIAEKLRAAPPPKFITGLSGDLATELIEIPITTPTEALLTFADHLTAQFPIVGELFKSIIEPCTHFFATGLVAGADQIADALLNNPNASLETLTENAATEDLKQTWVAAPDHSADWVKRTSANRAARQKSTGDRIAALDSEASAALLERVDRNESDLPLLKADPFISDPAIENIRREDARKLDLHDLALRAVITSRQLASTIKFSPERSRRIIGEARFEEITEADAHSPGNAWNGNHPIGSGDEPEDEPPVTEPVGESPMGAP
jgi:hypothetical protein